MLGQEASMNTEEPDPARVRWQRYINAPARQPLIAPYRRAAQEPDQFFDALGDDLGHPDEAIRRRAFWALVDATPELLDILHERESRQPGWSHAPGAEQ